MTDNRIRTDAFSNPFARELYEQKWPDEPACRAAYENGKQCGSCSFFAPFNDDWGLCCKHNSRHTLETVFEHFTCPDHVDEGWGPHSFSNSLEYHCRCGGEPLADTTGTPSHKPE